MKDKKLKEAGEADGMLTMEDEIFLGVLTADCVPILFLVPKNKLVAAVHAGWRGTLAGIAEKMVHLFQNSYGVEANELEVALGPSIGACCYEVKEDVAGPLLKRWGDIAKLSIQTGNGKMYLDLRQLNHDVLAQAGIPAENIFQVGPCTS